MSMVQARFPFGQPVCIVTAQMKVRINGRLISIVTAAAWQTLSKHLLFDF